MNKVFEIVKHRSFRISIFLSLIYLGTGFAMLHFGLAEYGWVIFVLLPFSLGVAIGEIQQKEWGYLGLFLGLLVFLIFILSAGLEGLVCVLLAIPEIILLLWLGILTNRLLKKWGMIKPKNNLHVMTLPLLVLLFGSPIEKYISNSGSKIISVKTERVFPYSPEKVYHAIKSVDTLIAEKPFLMKLDLPIPNKCVLQSEKVGGTRICYFDGGTITERITQLEPGKILKMDVIDYQLTGRKWLGFKEAIYYFEQIGAHGCKLTRITMYTSMLRPRIYWGPLEEIGISQEHDYVFENLNNDLKKKYDK